MKPITIRITAKINKPSNEICAAFIDTARWPEFKGYGFLPGILKADFENKAKELVGSKIRVTNTDGSSHVEEIIEWDVDRRISVRFQEFRSPLRRFATHFIETWEFRKSGGGTEVARSMTMYPKGFFGWAMLFPISKLMKKALERNLEQSTGE